MTDQASGPTPDALDVAALDEAQREAERWKSIVVEAALETYTPEGAEIVASKIHEYARRAEAVESVGEQVRHLTRVVRGLEISLDRAEARAAAAESARDAAEGEVRETDTEYVLLTEKCTERNCGNRVRYSELTDAANTHWHVKRGAALLPAPSFAPVATDATGGVLSEQARYEVKAAVEEWFTDISLDDLFKVKGWHAELPDRFAPVTTDATEGGS